MWAGTPRQSGDWCSQGARSLDIDTLHGAEQNLTHLFLADGISLDGTVKRGAPWQRCSDALNSLIEFDFVGNGSYLACYMCGWYSTGRRH
jgi:hypothetical protein